MPLSKAAAAPRSADPKDYQATQRPLAAMAKTFADGFEIAPHDHPRDQLIYAVSGTMHVRTDRHVWLVPPDRAVYLPAATRHAISCRGQVEMRTVYVATDIESLLPRVASVIAVSTLLRELILALLDEPIDYEITGRGGAIASLLQSEIERADILPLVVPMPVDARLQRVCLAILDDPSSPLTLQDWGDRGGASTRTLSRLFAAEVGLSFTVWRQRVRFHNALEALARGESVARVAQRNGYQSASAFTAAFRKCMGQTPKAAKNPPTVI